MPRSFRSWRIVRCAALALLVASCGPVDDGPHPLDLLPMPSDGLGKADGPGDALFIAGHLVSDDAFFDGGALDAAALQRFLEDTVYGKRSFLADWVGDDGRTFARALRDEAEHAGINPLVLLVTLQKESSLISRSVKPAKSKLDWALGCGCPDHQGCSTAFRGLTKQLRCAAELLRDAKRALDSGDPTVSGRHPGQTIKTLDKVSLRLANKATTILYTYTPWVLKGKGGNWLFWNIWRRYAKALGYDRGLSFPFNEGWIGGACATDGDCFYDGAACRFAETDDQGQLTLGICSKRCNTGCPDGDLRRVAMTFCVADPERAEDDSDPTGICVARCPTPEANAPHAKGCPAAQRCVAQERNGQPWIERPVCLPTL